MGNKSSSKTISGPGIKGDGSKKVITIFGATGAQGGSVVKAMMKDSKFRVRAVTRNPNSDKAKALKKMGVEVVQGDMDDQSSIEKAIEGSYGVFLNTNYWDHLSELREVKQGKDVINACSLGVKHIVYSSLAGVKNQTGEACPPFDSRAAVQEYLENQDDVMYTCVHMAWYMENFLTMFKPRLSDNGDYILDIPMMGKPLFIMSVADFGECIHKIFLDPERFRNKVIGLAAEHITVDECASVLNKYLPDRKYVPCDFDTDEYAKLGFPGADDLAAMYKFKQNVKEEQDIGLTKELNTKTCTFDTYVKNNLEKFKKI